VLTIVWSSGLAGRRGLAHPGSAIIDIGSEINFAALVLGGLLLTWLRPRNCIGWLLTLSGLPGATADTRSPGNRGLHAGAGDGNRTRTVSLGR